MVDMIEQHAEYPFQPKRIKVDGGEMAYLDEGRGPVVVCVHGNPSWSYLYRNLIVDLARNYRCIVPDHIGCGYSDKPQEYDYVLSQHIANLEALLSALEVEECTLVVHDWGGAIGMGWAGRHPGLVKGLVVLNTAAFRSRRMPFRIAVCRWPLIGDFVVRGLNGFARAAVHMAVCRKMHAKVAAGFLAPYDSWRNRVALLRFVQDIPLQPGHPSWRTLVEVERSLELLKEHPMLICWGGKDFCFTKHFYTEWQARFPDAEAHFFAEAGHYVLEDALPSILPLVRSFLDRQYANHG